MWLYILSLPYPTKALNNVDLLYFESQQCRYRVYIEENKCVQKLILFNFASFAYIRLSYNFRWYEQWVCEH